MESAHKLAFLLGRLGWLDAVRVPPGEPGEELLDDAMLLDGVPMRCLLVHELSRREIRWAPGLLAGPAAPLAARRVYLEHPDWATAVAASEDAQRLLDRYRVPLTAEPISEGTVAFWRSDELLRRRRTDAFVQKVRPMAGGVAFQDDEGVVRIVL